MVVPDFSAGGASHVAMSSSASSEHLRRFAGMDKARWKLQALPVWIYFYTARLPWRTFERTSGSDSPTK